MEGPNLDAGQFLGRVSGAQAGALLRRAPFCGMGWVLGGWNWEGGGACSVLTRGQLYGLTF